MKGLTIEVIKDFCSKGAIRRTDHVLIRLIQRNIDISEVECALMNGEIIEQYLDDYPYPSCLVLGVNLEQKSLHVVCGVSDTELWLVTAYYPDPNKWSNGFRTRKEHE